MLAYSQDFNPLVRIMANRRSEFWYSGYVKACGNKGVGNSKYSNKYTARILHTIPGGFPSHVSTGLVPCHSFVMPIQGVEAGFGAKMGLCPSGYRYHYSVLTLRSCEYTNIHYH